MFVRVNGSEISGRSGKLWLAIECGVLYLGVPGAYAIGWLPVPIIPLLLVMAVGCWLALRRWGKSPISTALRRPVPRAEWRRIIITYLIALPLLVGLLWLIEPAMLWSLLHRRPGIWALVMVAYPLVSVWPQEIIFRVFFFERYRGLFGAGWGIIAASAVVFSFAHIIFHNWLAVALTLPGGWLFARSYQRTSSLLLVFVEHALYGCAIFTIGYGEFFYKGTLRLFEH